MNINDNNTMHFSLRSLMDSSESSGHFRNIEVSLCTGMTVDCFMVC